MQEQTTKKLAEVKLLSFMEKVFPLTEPTGEGAQERLMACRGERVSFQIGYYFHSRGLGRGTVEISSPLKELITVRHVGLVPCEYPCHKEQDEDYLVTEPGLYPDVLKEIPKYGFPLVSGQWRSLWVEIEVPEEMDAGEYPVEICLHCRSIQNQLEVHRVNVVCQVLNAVLPKLPIVHTEWFHTDCLADYYKTEVFSERHWEIVENFVKAAAKRNCNMLLTPIFTPPLDTAVGGERTTVQLVDVWEGDGIYTFGFEKFRRWVQMALRCGMEYIEISHMFSQWGAAFAPKIMVRKNGELVKKFGWHTDACSEEYQDFLRQFLPQLLEQLKELGMEKRTYFHISDEPRTEHTESYQKAKELVLSYIRDYPLIDALSDYEFYQKGLVQIPVCSIDHIEPFLEHRPKELWGYYCTSQWKDVSNRFIAQPSYRTRIIGAQIYKHQLGGFLHWGFNFYNSQHSIFPINPHQCTDAGGAFPSGDPFIVYPGEDGEPEESLRLIVMDAAMNDIRAMTLLEELAGREEALECFGEEGEELTFTHYPRTVSYLTKVRRKVNEKIDACVKTV